MAAVSASSTHSTTVLTSKALASMIRLWMKTWFCRLVGRSAANEPSILMMSTGSDFRLANEVKPAPKSSIATLQPRLWIVDTNLDASSRSRAAWDSVISTISRPAEPGMRFRPSASLESQSGSSAVSFDTLSDNRASLFCSSVSSASSSVRWSIMPMKPSFSASGTKLPASPGRPLSSAIRIRHS